LRPSRRKTSVTVEFGMPSCRAIAGELIRCRRNRFDLGDALRRRAAHARKLRAGFCSAVAPAALPAPHPFAYGLPR
jgi:hypothetical protein